jgi:DNA-binding transcriptional MerR regulator
VEERRAASGYRVFGESALAELAFVGRATGIGMSLADIAGLVAERPAGECRSLRAGLRDFLTGRIGTPEHALPEAPGWHDEYPLAKGHAAALRQRSSSGYAPGRKIVNAAGRAVVGRTGPARPAPGTRLGPR